MNIQRIKGLEQEFLARYPKGFQDPEIVMIAAKHKMDQISKFTQESFAIEQFVHNKEIVENFAKLIGKSSMVSIFEKAKFRDFIKSIGGDEREGIVWGLKELLHGDSARGFETLNDIFAMEKLNKWPILTAVLIYFRPQTEVFIKPTTVKAIIEWCQLDMKYTSKPTWAFYESYRAAFNAMKAELSPLVSENNAAFSGFFMMTLPNMKEFNP